MVYGTQITIVMGVYTPTNMTGGPHIVLVGQPFVSESPSDEVSDVDHPSFGCSMT